MRKATCSTQTDGRSHLFSVLSVSRIAHPVQDGRPSLHGDALKDCQHGVDDVVEGGDAVVGALPLLQADGDFGITAEAAHRGSRGFVSVAGDLQKRSILKSMLQIHVTDPCYRSMLQIHVCR